LSSVFYLFLLTILRQVHLDDPLEELSGSESEFSAGEEFYDEADYVKDAIIPDGYCGDCGVKYLKVPSRFCPDCGTPIRTPALSSSPFSHFE
jgi:hypothetical protein